MQGRTSSDAVGSGNVNNDVNNLGLPRPHNRVEQLVQLAARLPPLPGDGHDDPRFLAQQLEGPAEGPCKGGAVHLHDKVHVQVVCAVKDKDDNIRTQAVGG